MELADLSPATRNWVQDIAAAFVLEAHHERLLIAAARAWDRAQEAREMVADQGAVLYGKTGMARPHPAVGIENASMLVFSKLLAQLKLDGDGRSTIPIPGARSHKRNLHVA